MARVIFHIDANSAFLSWTAAHRVLILGNRRICGKFLRQWLEIKPPAIASFWLRASQPSVMAFTRESRCFRRWRSVRISRWWSRITACMWNAPGTW